MFKTSSLSSYNEYAGTKNVKNNIIKGLVLLITLGLSQSTFATTVLVDQIVEKITTSNTKIIGKVRSREVANISAGIDGQLTWVAEAGTRFETGDVLATIDDTSLQMKKKIAEYESESLKIRQKQLQRELERFTKLDKQSHISQSNFEQVKSDLNYIESQLEVQKIKIEEVSYDLLRTKVIAPFPGIVTDRFKFGGEYANAPNALLSIVNDRHLEIVTEVPIRYFNRVQEGLLVPLSIRTLSGEGPVRSVINVTESRSQSFTVQIEPPIDMKSRLIVGEAVELVIPQRQRQKLMVHRDALLLRSDGIYIMKVIEENKVQKVQVVLGDTLNDLIEVTGDVNVGEFVVISGGENLHDGQEVIQVKKGKRS